MSIQYAGGTLVNTTFNSDGTRSQLVTQLATALTSAGWSTLSGGGTGDVVMKSAVTPQGLSICIEAKDPGSGNCAQVTMRTAAGDKVSAIAYMLPTSAKQFRIIADKYQFFFFSTGGANNQNAREIVMCGTLSVPSFIVLSPLEMGWFEFTGNTDTTTTANLTLRALTPVNENSTYFCTLWNGSLYNGAAVAGGPTVPSAPTSWAQATGLTWADGSLPVNDALLGWNDSGATGLSAQAITWRGQIWDSIAIPAPYTGETTVSWDSGTFMAITHNNQRGTLFIKVA
jgi:hypothetical protein